ncbi:MAG: polymer-forming cytoskeletal protein, partial [bacterium]|nr:polymer-forming cytoskeletal protein [bacterium]
PWRVRSLGLAAALIILIGGPMYVLIEHPKPYIECGSVSGNLIIDGREVSVPKGVVVHGDLRVYNVDLRVLGVVEGSIIMARSKVTIEPIAHIYGKIETVSWPWTERLKLSITQMQGDMRSLVREVWK